jgi:hypothetical protein
LGFFLSLRKRHGRAAEASPGRGQRSREEREQDLLLLNAETSPGRARVLLGKKRRRTGREDVAVDGGGSRSRSFY